MDPKVCGKLLTTHGEDDDDDDEGLRDGSPSGGAPEQDGISTGTEATAVELGFSLCSRSFWGTWTYIGRSRAPGDARGAHEVGARPGKGARSPPSWAPRCSPDVVLKFLWRDFLQKYLP